VATDDVKATYQDGILEVRVPCPADAEVAAPAKVPISHG
jgi:HSP20 family molecular chaperone IbpA